MDKKYKVSVSDPARLMLGVHVRFLAKVNVKAAREMQKRVMDSIRSLEKMPARFPFAQAEFIPLNKYRQMFVENWYLVLYQIVENKVLVDFIVDCRQDYGWLIR